MSVWFWTRCASQLWDIKYPVFWNAMFHIISIHVYLRVCTDGFKEYIHTVSDYTLWNAVCLPTSKLDLNYQQAENKNYPISNAMCLTIFLHLYMLILYLTWNAVCLATSLNDFPAYEKKDILVKMCGLQAPCKWSASWGQNSWFGLCYASQALFAGAGWDKNYTSDLKRLLPHTPLHVNCQQAEGKCSSILFKMRLASQHLCFTVQTEAASQPLCSTVQAEAASQPLYWIVQLRLPQNLYSKLCRLRPPRNLYIELCRLRLPHILYIELCSWGCLKTSIANCAHWGRLTTSILNCADWDCLTTFKLKV